MANHDEDVRVIIRIDIAASEIISRPMVRGDGAMIRPVLNAANRGRVSFIINLRGIVVFCRYYYEGNN